MFERLTTIRAITTIVATIVVALALTVGAIALVAAARRTMLDEVTEAAGKQAAEVVSQLESGRPPVLEVAGSDEQMVQVMTPAGAVVASSSNVAGQPAVARLAPGQSAQVITPLDNDAFIAVAQSAQTANGQRIVLVARALVDVLDTTKAITRLLIIGLPVMVVVVALDHLVRRGPRAGAGGGDPAGGGQNLCRAIEPARAAAQSPRRDRPVGRHHEPYAGAAGRRAKQSAPLRIRRVARVALARSPPSASTPRSRSRTPTG